MKLPPQKKEGQRAHFFQKLTEGFSYAFGFVPIRSLLLLLALVSLMGMPYTVLMPIFAENILRGGPQALGFLLGAAGVGALVGTFYLASRKTVLGLGRVVVIATGIFGVGLIAFSFSRLLWLSLIFMILTGFGMIVQMASTNTILQTLVEEDKRGRVMSLYTMAFMGMVPFGSLLSGTLANLIGAPGTIMVGGITCILGSFLFSRKLPALKEMVRPIYVKKGILPPDRP